MTITIEPLGGLGNQLFVYAVGLALAEHLDTSLEADLWKFHKYPWHTYELDTFTNLISRSYTNPIRSRVGKRLRIGSQVASKIGIHRLAPWGSLVTETSSQFDSRILESKGEVRLSGYFQSWRYFESLSSKINAAILSPVSPSSWMTEMTSKLDAKGNWVAVHVRLGNYLQFPEMGIVSEGYYERSLALIDKIHGCLPVAIFSDQPEIASQMACFRSDRFTVVNAPVSVRPIEFLKVMSCASALIIGNSTFSWWAAYVRDRPERTVIAPRPWLDSKKFNERDLFPRNWYTVGR